MDHRTAPRVVGIVCLLAFLATIPFANWWLDHYGLWNAPLLGPIPSAVWVIGIAFVLRDLAQLELGRGWAWAAIAVGTIMSFALAAPAIALASGVAFAFSETTDAIIFTPLANRGRFALGVALSGYLASAVDSLLFVWIAFGSPAGWWQLWIAKTVVVLAATPLAWLIRQHVAPRRELATA
jgi:uncharacterized PurR-regulated membrane protein YhhQ (DUF165 family)